MIHHLGPLVRRGEMTISTTNQLEGWLQLFGQDTLIRFELESQAPSAMDGCRFSFEHSADYKPESSEIPEIESIQFGQLIALRFSNVDPPMFNHHHVDLRIDGDYQSDFRLIWENQDEIIDITIQPAYLKMHWEDAQLRQPDHLPEEIFPSSIRESINQHINQIDRTYGEDEDEFLISVKMPTDSELDDLVIPRLQTMVHKVEEGPKQRMIDFMKEISEQNNNILISDLLEPPIQTPAPENMSDEQLQDKVVEILDRLSGLGIEFKRCEHFDNKLLYDWLINKVIPWERVHPELQQYQMTRFFDTSLWCDHCGIFQDL